MAKQKSGESSGEISQDVLDIVSDDAFRLALGRRRDALTGQLADALVDRVMPDFDEWPDEVKARLTSRITLYQKAIASIDDRLKRAAETLRSLA